jgi:hypothetical protein
MSDAYHTHIYTLSTEADACLMHHTHIYTLPEADACLMYIIPVCIHYQQK